MDGTQCGAWSKRTWPQKRQTVLPGRQAGPCPSPQTSETGVPSFGTRPALSCNDAPCSRSRGSQQPASAAQQADGRLVSALAPARAERGRAPLRCRPCRSRGLPCRTSRTSVRKQSPTRCAQISLWEFDHPSAIPASPTFSMSAVTSLVRITIR